MEWNAEFLVPQISKKVRSIKKSEGDSDREKIKGGLKEK